VLRFSDVVNPTVPFVDSSYGASDSVFPRSSPFSLSNCGVFATLLFQPSTSELVNSLLWASESIFSRSRPFPFSNSCIQPTPLFPVSIRVAPSADFIASFCQRSPRFNCRDSAVSASLHFDLSFLAHSRACEPSPERELSLFHGTPPFPESPLFQFSAFGPSGSFLLIPSAPPAEMSPASFHPQSVPESNVPGNQRESSLPMIVGVIGGVAILCGIAVAVILSRSRRPASTEYDVDESGGALEANSPVVNAFLTGVMSYADVLTTPHAVSFVPADGFPLDEMVTWRFDEDQPDPDAA
jgi:hypothetical protein